MQKVNFEPPVLSFMDNVNGGLHLRIGKESDVTLTTTYLDERVRVGKGSRYAVLPDSCPKNALMLPSARVM